MAMKAFCGVLGCHSGASTRSINAFKEPLQGLQNALDSFQSP